MRTWGPFTGRQLTILILALGFVGLPGSVWAATTFSNVAIQDPGSGTLAHVDSSGHLLSSTVSSDATTPVPDINGKTEEVVDTSSGANGGRPVSLWSGYTSDYKQITVVIVCTPDDPTATQDCPETRVAMQAFPNARDQSWTYWPTSGQISSLGSYKAVTFSGTEFQGISVSATDNSTLGTGSFETIHTIVLGRRN